MDPQQKQQQFGESLSKLMGQQTFKPPDMARAEEAARIAVEAQRATAEKYDFKQGVGQDGKPTWFAFDKTHPDAPAHEIKTVGADGKLQSVDSAVASKPNANLGKVTTVEGAPYGVLGPNGVVTPSDPEFAKGLNGDADWYKRKMDEGNKAYAMAEAKKVSLAGVRAETYVSSRHYAAINKKTGQLEYPNASQMNREPDLYAPVTGGMQAMAKEAVFGDIYYNVDNVEEAAQQMVAKGGAFTVKARANMLLALAHNDPAETVKTMISSGAMGNLTDEQGAYLRAIASLSENAMAMRSVAGLGQGSEDLRNAIRAVVPNAGTPNLKYLQGQLKLFRGTAQRLEKGVPGVVYKQSAAPISDPNAIPDSN
jgi:hypothetical protein